jgi:hypothetical protein
MEHYMISTALMDAICDALTRLPYREVQGVIIQLSREIAEQEEAQEQAPQLITR